MKIAFIGLGSIGLPMATNLLNAGYPLTVWNRNVERSALLAARGATEAKSAREAAEEADVLITMLSDDEATWEVMVGSARALDALRPGAVYLNMASISVAMAIQLAELCRQRGIGYLAAPVLGRVNVAEAGQLNILAAGDLDLLAKVQPLFDVLGSKTWHFGPRPEQANAVKLAMNFMIACAIGTLGEAVAMMRGHGVDPAEFLQLATTTVFAAPAYKGYAAAIAENRFEPAGFKLALGLKDVRLALQAAEQVNLPMPLTSTLRDSHIESLAHGEGHLDWAALSRTSARRANQL